MSTKVCVIKYLVDKMFTLAILHHVDKIYIKNKEIEYLYVLRL